MQLRRDYVSFKEAGGEIVAVGQGTPQYLDQFARQFAIPFPCLCDVSLKSYEAYGLKKGTFNEIMGPRVLLKGIRSMIFKGVKMGKVVGDPKQMSGAFVIDTRGNLCFSHIGKTSDDIPQNEALLTEIKKLTQTK